MWSPSLCRWCILLLPVISATPTTASSTSPTTSTTTTTTIPPFTSSDASSPLITTPPYLDQDPAANFQQRYHLTTYYSCVTFDADTVHCGTHEPVLKGGDDIPTGEGNRVLNVPGFGGTGKSRWRGWGWGVMVLGVAVGWAGLL